MSKKILWTTSYEDIINSIIDICGCKKDEIEKYLKHTSPLFNKDVTEINIEKFFKCIGIKFDNKIELYHLIKFDSCVISHVTSRLNEPDKNEIYNLIDSLTLSTELSDFLSSKGLIFKKNNDKVDVYYNDDVVDWNKFDNSRAHRVKNRLKIKGKYIDNCINGFLFNDLFWKDSNVEHITKCPEIISDICKLLNRHDIEVEWEGKSTSYALGFLADIQNVIIDEHSSYKTIKSKVYLIYKHILNYLVKNYHNDWNERHDNIIVRLKDNYSVSKNDIIGFYKIEENKN